MGKAGGFIMQAIAGSKRGLFQSFYRAGRHTGPARASGALELATGQAEHDEIYSGIHHSSICGSSLSVERSRAKPVSLAP
jgi:hypothetical protein